jgi:predicted Fe-Mo cluster-binding NifX family protein
MKIASTGKVGPKAFRMLRAAGIAVYRFGGDTAGDVLKQFEAGALQETTDANVEEHWA